MDGSPELLEAHPELIDLASAYLSQDRATCLAHCRQVEGLDALYVWSPERGGGALLIAVDHSVLFANSSISFEDHLAAFKGGRRTDPEAFSD